MARPKGTTKENSLIQDIYFRPSRKILAELDKRAKAGNLTRSDVIRRLLEKVLGIITP